MQGLIYKKEFVTDSQKKEILKYIESIQPIWENRFSINNPPPQGSEQRQLLRPVYWLGNWQFACLNYFHPPHNIRNCCVEAESFPVDIQNLADRIQDLCHAHFDAKDIPKGWHFNTCLINFYGHAIDENGKKQERARVGEHKDFEPGPVGSVSFGERALFQFVNSRSKSSMSQVVLQQWLDDSSLQVFGGDRFKRKLFHRVQRVDHKSQRLIGPKISNFATRRLNLTFRYVPNEFIIPYPELPENLRADLIPYIEQLGQKSKFWLNFSEKA